MKKIFTLLTTGALALLSLKSNSQFSQNFDSGAPALTGDCWTLTQIEWSGDANDVINGTGSLYSNPPVNNSSTRDILTPALDVISTSLSVSFNYKLSNKINGNATRTIEIGLYDIAGNYTSLELITLDKNSPVTVQAYSNTFTVTPGLWKIVVKIGGTIGDGNTRVILDDFSTDGTPHYGPFGFCNDAPIAVDDTFLGVIGNPVFGNVMTNDNEPNGETMTSAVVLTSADGILILNPDGSFSFVPSITFVGTTTTFTYNLTDNGFAPVVSNTATVTINFAASGSLPVHLISFQGNMNKNNKVTLQWKVADNETASHFEVQRSANGRDFTTIGIVMATDKTAIENYSYAETVNSNEKVMYRLRMIDKHQDADYSKILVLQNKTSNNDNLIKIFSNPVNDKLTFSFSSSSTQTVDVKVYDMSGRRQLDQKVNSYEGSNMISLPLSSTFKPGMYVVEVNDGTVRHMAKFVKQ